MIKAVLFDRDGTLVVDAGGSTDPAMLQPMPGARDALALLHESGFLIGVITNQPGVAAGRISANALHALHRRIEESVGRIDGWFVCPHAADAGCDCRKPKPGLIFQATHAFGIVPQECTVVGDIGSDMLAACSAGSSAVLVPTPVTRPEEVARAPRIAATLLEAARSIVRERGAAT